MKTRQLIAAHSVAFATASALATDVPFKAADCGLTPSLDRLR
jgi:hypothetical protein